ncbi:helix-turn-helix domain-containing protein [Companilactobacillus sp. FL22-1]|uniref:helix-turn-helix domain-containing protein n=1 Tax=Companilactobacillus sp. FL22-1 TaxID=3373892 RepID=UPI003754CCAA
MDINIFIERRKLLKMSQVKLCKGICTQSTLSKFENNGRVPSLNILNKLCERLGLSVDDLYRNSNNSTTHMRTVLDKVEKEFMMENYSDVSAMLQEIDSEVINNDMLKMQYYYQKGFFNVLTKGKFEDAFYNFSRILDELDEIHKTIYTFLAYTGLGVLYSRENKMQEAEFFFQKVFEFIKIHENEKYQKANVNMYLRVLTIVFFTADFYIQKGMFDEGERLVDRGIRLCSEQHITYYLARLKYLSAKIAIGKNKSNEVVDGLLIEALAFAKINHNEPVELRINALRKQYEDSLNKEEE